MALSSYRRLFLSRPLERERDEEVERFLRPFFFFFFLFRLLELDEDEEELRPRDTDMAAFASGAPVIVTLIILTGVSGLSFMVGTWEILVKVSMPDLIMPKTGCFESPGVNQSR
mmetsp:Transcript_38075/g.104796  ORF Transcript_38075/g.104796 Transcript_38075/m.104796 type:complete len:114 (-) Transcript_38075:475-816(-)